MVVRDKEIRDHFRLLFQFRLSPSPHRAGLCPSLHLCQPETLGFVTETPRMKQKNLVWRHLVCVCVFRGNISHLQIDSQSLGVFTQSVTRKDRYYCDVIIEKSSHVRCLNKQEL